MKAVAVKQQSKANVLILLWHPEGKYSGGSYNSHNISFRYFHQTKNKWLLWDKQGSLFEENESANFKLHEYTTPRVILRLTGYSLAVGRLLEWNYLFWYGLWHLPRLIQRWRITTIYLPIAEFPYLTYLAYALKLLYKLRVVAVVHQLDDLEATKNLVHHTKMLRASGMGFFNAFAIAAQSRFNMRFMLFCLKRVDKVGVISVWMQKRMQKMLKRDITYLEYGFDTAKYTAVPAQKKVYDAAYVGRLVADKGLYDLLEVWQKVIARQPKATLALIGPGEKVYVDELHQAIKARKMTDNVILTGVKYDEEKIKLLKSAKLFLFLSPMESYAQVIDEAIVCQLPLVTYDLEVYRSRFAYSSHFYTYAFRDYQAITAKILEILAKPTVYSTPPITSFGSWQDFAKQEQRFVLD